MRGDKVWCYLVDYNDVLSSAIVYHTYRDKTIYIDTHTNLLQSANIHTYILFICCLHMYTCTQTYTVIHTYLHTHIYSLYTVYKYILASILYILFIDVLVHTCIQTLVYCHTYILAYTQILLIYSLYEVEIVGIHIHLTWTRFSPILSIHVYLHTHIWMLTYTVYTYILPYSQ